MKVLLVSCLMLYYMNISISVELNYKNQQNPAPHFVSSSGAPVDEVIVESSLYIKPKQKLLLRRSRSAPSLIKIRLKRALQNKRFNRPPSQSQSVASAAANNFYNNPNGHGTSAASAEAQTFHSQGDLPSFGASSAYSQTQSSTANRNGIQAGAGASLAQTYILPNGQSINFANTNNFSNGLGGNAASRGSSVQIHKKLIL